MALNIMNYMYIETCTKIAVFGTVEQLSTSKISSTCPTGVNYISKYAGDLREKVMKFEREMPIGLDARRRKRQGGPNAPLPPMGLGLS